MLVLFSRARLSMRIASEKASSIVAQVLWWAIVLVVGVIFAAYLNAPASAYGRHHHRPRVSPTQYQGDYTFIGDRYALFGHVTSHGSVTEARRVHRSVEALESTGRRVRRASHYTGNGLVTVATAAGLDITVAPGFASKIEGFIGDLVARGYHPHQIHCYASGGHVQGSLHYSGHACDFDQRGWGLTAKPMYHVADLVAKWGLRDGGEFRDWGHIDDGPHLNRHRRLAAIQATPFYGPTSLYRNPTSLQ